MRQKQTQVLITLISIQHFPVLALPDHTHYRSEDLVMAEAVQTLVHLLH